MTNDGRSWADVAGAILDGLRALQDVIFARKALRSHRDLRDVLRALDDPAPSARTASPERLARGVRTAMRAVGPRSDACVPRSLALYRRLRRHGFDARFVSGVTRDADGLDGHAWVEVDGRPVHGSGDEHAPKRYRVTFSYPAAPD